MEEKSPCKYTEPKDYTDSLKAYNGSTPPAQFLAQLKIAVATYPKRFANDRSKVLLLLSHLEGPALDWAIPFISDECLDFESFTKSLIKAFQPKHSPLVDLERLNNLKQGQKTILEYLQDFRKISANLKVDDLSLILAFRTGLNTQFQDELVHEEPADSFLETVEIAKRIELRLEARALARKREIPQVEAQAPHTKRTSTEPNRMKSLKNYWKSKGLCLSCGGNDHRIATCPVKPPGKPPKEEVQSTK
jgi:hypothetical protein